MNASQSDSELSETLDGEDSESGGSTSMNSSSSSASSYTSTQFDDEEEDKNMLLQSTENEFELVQIGNVVLRLPRDLCANKEIFNEFFSVHTWNVLPADIQQLLMSLLPKFDNFIKSKEELAKEQQLTIEMLFNNKLDCFGTTPFQRMQKELEAGNYRPDVVKLRKSIDKSTRREQRFQTCERLSYLARELFIKRERLLRNVYQCAAPAGSEPIAIPRQHTVANNKICVDNKMYVVRARQRYAEEMELLLDNVGLKASDLKAYDDDDDEELSEHASDKHINAVQSSFNKAMSLGNSNSSSVTEKCVYGTLFKRRPNVRDDDAQYQQLYAKQPRLNNKHFRTYLQTYRRRKQTEPVC